MGGTGSASARLLQARAGWRTVSISSIQTLLFQKTSAKQTSLPVDLRTMISHHLIDSLLFVCLVECIRTTYLYFIPNEQSLTCSGHNKAEFLIIHYFLKLPSIFRINSFSNSIHSLEVCLGHQSKNV